MTVDEILNSIEMMMKPDQIQHSVVVATAIVTTLGAIGTFIAGFVSWLEKRSTKTKNNNAIDWANSEISFLTTWFKAQESFCTPERLEKVKLEIVEEFDDIKKRLPQFMSHPMQSVSSTFSLKRAIKQTFLLYLPHGIVGWIYLFLFYTFLIGFCLYLIGMSTSVDKATTLTVDIVAAIFIFLIPLIFIQQLALRKELARTADKTV